MEEERPKATFGVSQDFALCKTGAHEKADLLARFAEHICASDLG
jgi:hypothetical protein